MDTAWTRRVEEEEKHKWLFAKRKAFFVRRKTKGTETKNCMPAMTMCVTLCYTGYYIITITNHF